MEVTSAPAAQRCTRCRPVEDWRVGRMRDDRTSEPLAKEGRVTGMIRVPVGQQDPGQVACASDAGSPQVGNETSTL